MGPALIVPPPLPHGRHGHNVAAAIMLGVSCARACRVSFSDSRIRDPVRRSWLFTKEEINSCCSAGDREALQRKNEQWCNFCNVEGRAAVELAARTGGRGTKRQRLRCHDEEQEKPPCRSHRARRSPHGGVEVWKVWIVWKVWFNRARQFHHESK